MFTKYKKTLITPKQKQLSKKNEQKIQKDISPNKRNKRTIST